MEKIKEISLSSSKKFELINITPEIEDSASKAGVRDGLCFVFVPHATCALVMNEDESGVREDILERIKALAPESKNYLHDRIDNNARAHVIASVIGASLTLPIYQGDLIRGTWQDIFLVELDGPRSHRRVVIKIMEG